MIMTGHNAQEIALVLGTAGHIDHGKTTLIAALTGVDCDRLIEEKRRGITIELGFAPLHIQNPDGSERVVSVIDVPGHEKFIRQMVAGASGIDAALLVVAADEGVMPQTREHLAIMELLGVHDGLVAITKIDRVEPDFVELVREDIEQFVKGTFLDGKAIVPVSSVSTGNPESGRQNLDTLRQEISALIDRVKPRSRGGALFLPIDRAFPISGFGTVITGTAYHGVAKLGDEIEVLPALAAGAGTANSGLSGKLRSIQVHGHPVESAFAGQRVAANLSGIAVDQIQRGDVVCQKNVYRSTTCFDAVIQLLSKSSGTSQTGGQAIEPIKHWQRVHLCIGTSEVLARVALLDDKQVTPGGGETSVQLVLEEPVVCTSGQKFILRFYSPLITIGGGTVVYPYSHKPRNAKDRVRFKARIEALQAALTPEDRMACLVATSDSGAMDTTEAARAIQERPENLSSIAARAAKANKLVVLNEGQGQAGGNLYLSPVALKALENLLVTTVRAYQKSYPAEAGLPFDGALRALASDVVGTKLDPRTLRSLVTLMSEKGLIIADENSMGPAGGTRIHTPDFTPRSDGEFAKNVQVLNDFCRKRGWQLATLDEVRSQLSLPAPEFDRLIQSLKNSRGLALLGSNQASSGSLLVLTAELEGQMLDILRKIVSGSSSGSVANGGVTLAAVRDATQSTRKFILPVLEYFDSRGYTRRVGDVRILAGGAK